MRPAVLLTAIFLANCGPQASNTAANAGQPPATAAPFTLAACDAPRLVASLRTVVEAGAHQALTAFDNIQTVMRNPTSSVCTVHELFANGEEWTDTYILSPGGGGLTNFDISATHQIRGPNGSPPAQAGPPALAECDGPMLVAALRTVVEDRSHLTLTAFDDIRTVTRSADAGVCTVQAAFSNGEAWTYTYTLSPGAGGLTNFLITAVQQIQGPNGPPPASDRAPSAP